MKDSKSSTVVFWAYFIAREVKQSARIFKEQGSVF